MSYINPDYPVTVGSFDQHTWSGQQAKNDQNTFYYGGMGYGTMFPDNGARRPDGNMPQYGTFNQATGYYGQQPVMPPQSQIPTGVGQMLSTPEQGVQPFSSYPPQNTTPQYGFNQFTTEARRADANAAQVVGNNPWAPTPTPQPAPSYSYQPQPQNTFYYGYQSTGCVDAPAMYQYNQQQNPFEKKPGVNMWDNMYVQPQPYVPASPTPMQWSTPQTAPAPQLNMHDFPSIPPVPQYGGGYGYPTYPPQQDMQQKSWTMISHQSWDGK